MPRALLQGRSLHAVLKIDRPASRELGMSGDARRLGVGLHAVRLDHVP